MDRHMKPPHHVRCNMRGLFDGPEALQGALLGVVTELSYDGSDGALCVTGGIGDTGLHEELASRLGSETGKFMRLPSEMASSEGMVRAWREAGCDGRIGIFVAQNDTLANPDALFSYRSTDRQLRMAGVGTGYTAAVSTERSCGADRCGARIGDWPAAAEPCDAPAAS